MKQNLKIIVVILLFSVNVELSAQFHQHPDVLLAEISAARDETEKILAQLSRHPWETAAEFATRRATYYDGNDPAAMRLREAITALHETAFTIPSDKVSIKAIGFNQETKNWRLEVKSNDPAVPYQGEVLYNIAKASDIGSAYYAIENAQKAGTLTGTIEYRVLVDGKKQWRVGNMDLLIRTDQWSPVIILPIFRLLAIGMITDAGTIDDKSFNQRTWEGVLRAGSELGADTMYLKPTGTTEADYLKEIANLYDAGYKFMVTSGFKFETTIFQAQNRYRDAKFVLIDGSPHAGDYNLVVGPNTVSIFFAEHEAGFLAGVATAVEMKSGSFGFIGGMEIPLVQKLNWGFQRGVDYANRNLGTNVEMKTENIIYQGSFDNVAAGQRLAALMYDRGVNVIFCVAGGVAVGAIYEAKARAAAGRTAWIVGVDVDQYADGFFSSNQSIMLTSAIKRFDVAAFDMIKAELEGHFPGGQTLNLDVTNNGVGIPADNPNLSAATQAVVADVFSKMKAGHILVPAYRGEFLR